MVAKTVGRRSKANQLLDQRKISMSEWIELKRKEIARNLDQDIRRSVIRSLIEKIMAGGKRSQRVKRVWGIHVFNTLTEILRSQLQLTNRRVNQIYRLMNE